LQDLASLKLMLSTARRSDDREQVAHVLDQAIEQITFGIASLRRLINDLRPPLLDEAGVQPALEHLVQRLSTVSELDVQMDIDLAYESGRRTHRLQPAVEDALYRVVQEALNNVIKHAGATRVEVSIIELENRIDVRIADDGIGIGDSRDSGGFGLMGMQERIELIGGELEVIDPAAGGTELRAWVPVTTEAAGV
jgi:signal transduction histidine kinase